MSEEIRLVKELNEKDRQRLFGWGENIFGIEDGKYSWRPKDLHFILDVDGEAASHVGLVEQTVDVGGQLVRVAGVGGVVTNGNLHGRGYAQKTLTRAEAFMCEELKVEFGLLFCLDHRLSLYAGRGWQLLSVPVEIEQPSGRMLSPMHVMVLPCGDRVWPAGAVDLRGYPW